MIIGGSCENPLGGGRVKGVLSHSFDNIISIDNLLITWNHFLRGKRKRKDVQEFQLQLADNLMSLHCDLANKTYCHGSYQAFNISDPKPRCIHKASVRDRLVHQLVYDILYWQFDKRFIFDSYSSRENKGIHKAMNRFKLFAGQVSHNHRRTGYVLKGDIRKFFENINQAILLKILQRQISDPDLLWLIKQVLASFCAKISEMGLPLGNLTSQLFANIYMNEFDRFVKQELRVKHYIRFADDFVILSIDRNYLVGILMKLNIFLSGELRLSMHPNKVFIKTYASGVDFLGWTHFVKHRNIRTTTKNRMIKKLSGWPKLETVNSYRGLLSHGNTYKIRKRLNLV